MRQARIDSEGLKSQASPFRGGRVAYPNAAIAVGSMLMPISSCTRTTLPRYPRRL